MGERGRVKGRESRVEGQNRGGIVADFVLTDSGGYTGANQTSIRTPADGATPGVPVYRWWVARPAGGRVAQQQESAGDASRARLVCSAEDLSAQSPPQLTLGRCVSDFLSRRDPAPKWAGPPGLQESVSAQPLDSAPPMNGYTRALCRGTRQRAGRRISPAPSGRGDHQSTAESPVQVTQPLTPKPCASRRRR